jgi:glycosyltransferase involved in cell wall biosynthesis
MAHEAGGVKVLVSHPGLQHSHQLAWALEETGHLAEFWSGVPVRDSRKVGVAKLNHWTSKLRQVPINSDKRRHAVLFPLLERYVISRIPDQWASDFSHRLDHLYDWWVARRVAALRPEVVVCYENAALRTFEAAKRIGAICILDAASVHYATQRQQLMSLGRANPKWVDAQKAREIELADAVLTCSRLAASTYAAAGVLEGKLDAVPLGADLYPEGVATEKRTSPTLRFVFVGALRVVKGVDVLLDIFEQMENEAIPAHLTLIGGVAEASLATRARSLTNVTLLPFVAHPAVFEEMARHDVLLLPSRFDSFGMVVPEAMVVGLPALVTDQVGAKCIIEQHPDAGWIVPFQREAIREKILDLIARPDQLRLASIAARHAARDYNWINYRKRVVMTLERIYTDKKRRV